MVYAAYDPELDRRVALKLLHAGGGDASQLTSRLLREAQAMARLSHPNVIAVHDVGTVGDQVFLAMEFVDGETLGQWVREKPRPWQETLRLFILAGRGLAAAHAVKLVHRDFKPDNVMVGKDGSVRVTDFGLARAEERPATGELSAFATLPGLPVSPASLTDSGAGAGALLGSPAYMSLEQMRGDTLDARADQFSFCVALYEALYGERPFAGDDLVAISNQITQGSVRKEPESTRVPARIRRALLRGMSARPEDRFPTLAQLLDLLALDPAVRRQKIGIALGLGTLALVAILLARFQAGKNARLCAGAEEKLHGVWDAQLREQGSTAFAATKKAFANTAWSLAEHALDDYAKAWTAMRTDACEATAVRGEQSAELLDLRMACLDDRLSGVKAVTSLFGSADEKVVSHAADVVGGLKPLEACADTAALRAGAAPPVASKAAVEEVHAGLARFDASINAGKPLLPLAQELQAAAQKTGYPPIEAQTMFALAHAEELLGDGKSAQRDYLRATASALASKDDGVLASAWVALIGVDLNLSQLDAAEAAAVQAKAAVSRIAGSKAAQGGLLSQLAELALMQNRVEEATTDAEQAVALLEPDPANARATIAALGELGETLGQRALWDRAIEVQGRAWKMASDRYGAEHPFAAELEEELGSLLTQRERIGEAMSHLRHALQAFERDFGPDYPSVADTLNYLAANVLIRRPAEAVPDLERALRIEEKANGKIAQSIVFSRFLLGGALTELGKLEPARKQMEEAIAMQHQVNPDPHDLEIAMLQTGLAEILFEEGKGTEARAMLEANIAVQKKGWGPDHPQLADSEWMLASIDLEAGRLATARALCEDSLRIARLDIPGVSSASLERELLLSEIEIAQGQPDTARPRLEELVAMPPAAEDQPKLDRGRAQFLLARALWPDKSQRARALEEATAAVHEYEVDPQPGPHLARDRTELANWIAAHRTEL